MLLVPLICLGILEVGLHLAGFGYPTSFLLPFSADGQKIFIQNNQFGWRFFGAQMAREPADIALPQAKESGTVRIFIFGESAAFGDPQPEFGLPRMLQAMLELRHPGVKFEVANTAMTGINSHVILPIARDCARAGGDIWVIYLGNNEVIGPFGAGTVFGRQTPPLPFIRASLAFKATRTGELFDSLFHQFHPPPAGKSEWGGMEMFLGQQVRASDPRMDGVYDSFAKNLTDIIRLGHESGAGIVVSTVAVNLKDCAPFASQHRADPRQRNSPDGRSFSAPASKPSRPGKFQKPPRGFKPPGSWMTRLPNSAFGRRNARSRRATWPPRKSSLPPRATWTQCVFVVKPG